MRKWTVVALAGLLALSVSQVAAAQGQPAQFVQVTAVSVKLGMQGEFEDYVKKIVAGLTKINSLQRISANQVTLGGSPTTYFFSTPFEKWADEDLFDSIPQTLIKAYGEVEGPRILKTGRASVDSRRIIEEGLRCVKNRVTLVLTFRPDLSRLTVTAPSSK